MGSLVEMEAEGGVLYGQLGWLVSLLEWAAAGIDIAAILLILIGGVRFILGVGKAEIILRGVDRVRETNRERVELGRYILASLELSLIHI